MKLQTAATFCIGNLAWNEDSGCLERQARLRELGVYRILQQLLCTNDATLFEKYSIQIFFFLLTSYIIYFGAGSRRRFNNFLKKLSIGGEK